MAQGFTKQSITYADGDVVGPASSTDLALARFDGTTGKLLQDSTVLVTDNGEMTNGSQPAFGAYLTTTITNVTGDGTLYTIIYDTERFDNNADFNLGTSTFTAPVTGRYQFNFQCRLTGGVAANDFRYQIVTSNQTYRSTNGPPSDITRTYCNSLNVTADMDTSDTCTFTVQVFTNGADDMDVFGNVNAANNVSGFLVC